MFERVPTLHGSAPNFDEAEKFSNDMNVFKTIILNWIKLIKKILRAKSKYYYLLKEEMEKKKLANLLFHMKKKFNLFKTILFGILSKLSFILTKICLKHVYGEILLPQRKAHRFELTMPRNKYAHYCCPSLF